jgi:hypothetical protein
MRRSRTLVLGATILAMAMLAVACSSGGDDTSGTPTGSAGGGTIASQLTLGGPPECPDRPFCIPGLKDTYGIEFGDFKPLLKKAKLPNIRFHDLRLRIEPFGDFFIGGEGLLVLRLRDATGRRNLQRKLPADAEKIAVETRHVHRGGR